MIKIILISLLNFVACKNEKSENKALKTTEYMTSFDAFGAVISENEAISSSEMLSKYQQLKRGDTLNVKFASSIKEVCSKKGCWMKLPLDTVTETMVRFKNYGFFMPLDSKNRKVIVEGKAYLTEISVENLKHYAKDAGKSSEEIAKITTPKEEFAFEAKGVLMKK